MNLIAYADALERNIDKLKDNAAALKSRVEAIDKVKETVQNLPDKLRYDVMVPYGPHAFYSGKLIHTNEFQVDVGSDYRVEATAKQACAILTRRQANIEENLSEVDSQIKDLQAKFDVLNVTVRNEEGDNFCEIRQSLEESEQMLSDALKKIKSSPNNKVLEELIEEPIAEADRGDDATLDYDELLRLEEEAERLGLSDEEAADMVKKHKQMKSPSSRLSKASFPDSRPSATVEDSPSSSAVSAPASSSNAKSKGFKKGFFGSASPKPKSSSKVSFAADVADTSVASKPGQPITATSSRPKSSLSYEETISREDEPFNGTILERPSATAAPFTIPSSAAAGVASRAINTHVDLPTAALSNAHRVPAGSVLSSDLALSSMGVAEFALGGNVVERTPVASAPAPPSRPLSKFKQRRMEHQQGHA